MDEPVIIKVRIPLDDGIVAGETLWAEQMGPSRARLANIPFCALGYALGDIVAVQVETDDVPTVTGVVTPSGDLTWQMLARPGHERDLIDVAVQLRALGCHTECAQAAVWSLSVPAARQASAHALLSAHRAVLEFSDE